MHNKDLKVIPKNIKTLYSVFKTIIEMMNDRGYKI